MRGAFGNSALTPPNIGNRVFWWNAAGDAGGSFLDEAATVPASDNARVASIKGAEGIVWTQATTTYRPLFRLNRQNALPGLYFSSARKDHLKNPSGGLLNTVRQLAAFTVMVVWRPVARTAVAMRLAGAGNSAFVLATTSASHIIAYRVGDLSQNNFDEIAAASSFGVASAALFNFLGFGATMGLYDNHANSDTAVTDDADDGVSWEDGFIGANSTGDAGIEADIFEILIWDTAADGTQRTAALAYATAKWALT